MSEFMTASSGSQYQNGGIHQRKFNQLNRNQMQMKIFHVCLIITAKGKWLKLKVEVKTFLAFLGNHV